MNNNVNLQKLNKSELLKIIKKMKKDDLINIINNKIGGGDLSIIKETNNAIRTPLESSKYSKKNNAMANDNLYNKLYTKKNII